ncbi:MAG: molybdopterin-dependent oxidoreductase [Myxococcota bacterium]
MSLEARRLDTQQGLRAAAAVGVVRDGDGDRAARIATALLEGGLQAVQITTTTPSAFETVRKLGSDHPHALIGVGSAMKAAHVKAAAAASARFVVSPHTDASVIEAARSQGLVSICGALTPTEIVAAKQAGADFIKIFPVSSMGGPNYLRALNGPLPQLGYWASGNVEINAIGDFLSAGAELVELAGALTSDLPDNLEATVRKRAEDTIRAITQFREGTALLTIAVGRQEAELGMKAIRRLPGSEHTRLDAFLPGRRGHAVRLRVLLQSAGVPPKGQVRLVSLDGFARTIDAKLLYDAGLLHYATDGHPIGKDQGGPLRLYIVNGSDQCDNLKGLCRIEAAKS